MSTYVALLRGVNVGGQNKVPMAALKELWASLGYRDVRTLIQSGNVVFTSERSVDPVDLGAAITGRWGIDVTVVLRNGADLRAVVEADPLPDADRAKLHVGFMARPPAASVVRGLDGSAFAPEEFAVVGREVYLHMPNGLGRSKLPAWLGRRLNVPVTIRNWNTVTKLLEMTGG